MISTQKVFVIFVVCLCAIGVCNGRRIEKRGVMDTVKEYGSKGMKAFDDVFYGLMDSISEKMLDGQKGEFKDMLLRHRQDMYDQVKNNLGDKDDITVDKIGNVMKNEMNNRLELFQFLGSKVGNKLKEVPGMFTSYKNKWDEYCVQNPSKFVCTFHSKQSTG